MYATVSYFDCFSLYKQWGGGILFKYERFTEPNIRKIVVKTLPMLDSNTEKELRLRILIVLFLLNDFSETMPLQYGVQHPKLSIATNVAYTFCTP